MKGVRTTRLMAALAAVVLLSACASAPIKQKALVSLQSIESALGAAQDFERASYQSLGLNVLASDTEKALCPAIVLPTPLPANATKHQVVSCLFAQAFNSQIASTQALRDWKTDDPVPPMTTALHGQINALFGIVNGLPLNDGQRTLVGHVQQALTIVLSVVGSLMGGAQ